MTAKNQGAVRLAVGTLVTDNMVGTGKKLVAVYTSIPSTFNKKSPVMLILKRGIGRGFAGMGSKNYDNQVRMRVQIFVASASSESGITEEQVDEDLDAVDQEFAQLLANNQKGDEWRALRYTGEPSETLDIIYLDRTPYRMEESYIMTESPDV